MEYVLVFLAALLVGAIVYRVTLRQEQEGPAASTAGGEWAATAESEWAGSTEGAPPAPPPPPGGVYVPLMPASRTWETRVSGLVGILVLVTISAAALAFAVYLGGSFLIGLFGDAASNGGVNGGLP